MCIPEVQVLLLVALVIILLVPILLLFFFVLSPILLLILFVLLPLIYMLRQAAILLARSPTVQKQSLVLVLIVSSLLAVISLLKEYQFTVSKMQSKTCGFKTNSSNASCRWSS